MATTATQSIGPTVYPDRPLSLESAFDACSHRRKLARADVHIRSVQSTLNGWILDGGYRIWNVTDDEGFSSAYAQQTMPFPKELPAIIGDALQCLRNSLDNLAYSLAISHHTPEELLGSDVEDISFPIRNEAVTRETRALRSMSGPVKDAIIALAPDPERTPLHLDLLWLLNQAAHQDRRGALRLTATARIKNVFVDGAALPLNVSPPKNGFGLCTEPVLINKWNLASAIPGSLTVEFKAAFGGPPTGIANLSFMVMLWKWHDHIRDQVFPHLERHLKAKNV